MAEGREPQTEPWPPGTIVASRYEVLEHLGTGGMGVVYRAKDLLNQRNVALKTIRRDLDDERRLLVSKLLRAEAEALSRVDSDFVVRVFEAHAGSGEGTDDPFVAMELLRGRDLERLLKEDGSMAPGLALPLLWQAACGLKAIHARDIVHRDLKPANLYIKTRDDGTRELKILDFSISRLLDRAAGQKTTMIVGTRGFMAPEQAAGYDVDHRADLFALGQVAHEMLLGPKGDATPPANFPMAGFLAWHAKATASDRRERFTTATEAIQELATVLGVPLSAGAASDAPTPGLFETATTVLATAPRRRPQLLLLGLGAASLAVAVALHYQATPRDAAAVASARESSPPSLASSAVISATAPSALAPLAPPQPSSLPSGSALPPASALPAPVARPRRPAATGGAPAPSPHAAARASDEF